MSDDNNNNNNNGLGYITELNPTDVLFGRGSGPNDHEGNIRFRYLVADRKNEYLATNHRQTKAKIAREIVNAILMDQGRFLKKVEAHEGRRLGIPKGVDAWIIVDDDTVMEKAKQALRQNTNKAAENKRGLSPTRGGHSPLRGNSPVRNLSPVRGISGGGGVVVMGGGQLSPVRGVSPVRQGSGGGVMRGGGMPVVGLGDLEPLPLGMNANISTAQFASMTLQQQQQFQAQMQQQQLLQQQQQQQQLQQQQQALAASQQQQQQQFAASQMAGSLGRVGVVDHSVAATAAALGGWGNTGNNDQYNPNNLVVGAGGNNNNSNNYGANVNQMPQQQQQQHRGRQISNSSGQGQQGNDGWGGQQQPQNNNMAPPQPRGSGSGCGPVQYSNNNNNNNASGNGNGGGGASNDGLGEVSEEGLSTDDLRKRRQSLQMEDLMDSMSQLKTGDFSADAKLQESTDTMGTIEPIGAYDSAMSVTSFSSSTFSVFKGPLGESTDGMSFSRGVSRNSSSNEGPRMAQDIDASMQSMQSLQSIGSLGNLSEVWGSRGMSLLDRLVQEERERSGGDGGGGGGGDDEAAESARRATDDAASGDN